MTTKINLFLFLAIVQFAVPLTGNATWNRSVVGEISLDEIAYFEVNADTWDWGFEMWIDGVTFNDYVGVGINETGPDTPALEISPNPFDTNARLQLQLPQSGTVRIGIYNLYGKQVREVFSGNLSGGRHTLSIDGSGLPPGIYLLKLNTGKREVVRKVVRM